MKQIRIEVISSRRRKLIFLVTNSKDIKNSDKVSLSPNVEPLLNEGGKANKITRLPNKCKCMARRLNQESRVIRRRHLQLENISRSRK